MTISPIFNDVLKNIPSVSELTSKIRTTLEKTFHDAVCFGEISNFKIPGSGHAYFTLKDENASIRVVMFKGALQKLSYPLKDGMSVICKGRVTIYDKRGDYQIIAVDVQDIGIGKLALAFAELKEKLGKEGLFDESHKKPLPFLPEKIGVITSATGAAVKDILRVIYGRYPIAHVILVPTLVQGDGAANDIATAIRNVNDMNLVDVMIVGRGGGSLEDLWSFNEEVVARAIFDSCIPIISAVGHEVDFTIADFVADVRAPTPSVAGEMVVPKFLDLQLAIKNNDDRIELNTKHILSIHRDRLSGILTRVRSPETILINKRLYCDDLLYKIESKILNRLMQMKDRMNRCVSRLRSPDYLIPIKRRTLDGYIYQMNTRIVEYVTVGKRRFEEQAAKLDVMSPFRILSRGYSVTMRGKKIVSDEKDVEVNDLIETRLHHGSVVSMVISKPGVRQIYR